MLGSVHWKWNYRCGHGSWECANYRLGNSPAVVSHRFLEVYVAPGRLVDGRCTCKSVATTTAGNCISKHKATTKVGRTPRRQATTTIDKSKEPAAHTAATHNSKCQVATIVCKFPKSRRPQGRYTSNNQVPGRFASHIQWVTTVGTLTCTCHHGRLVAWKCV